MEWQRSSTARWKLACKGEEGVGRVRYTLTGRSSGATAVLPAGQPSFDSTDNIHFLGVPQGTRYQVPCTVLWWLIDMAHASPRMARSFRLYLRRHVIETET